MKCTFQHIVGPFSVQERAQIEHGTGSIKSVAETAAQIQKAHVNLPFDVLREVNKVNMPPFKVTAIYEYNNGAFNVYFANEHTGRESALLVRQVK